MKVKDFLGKVDGVTWMYHKADWPNDRIVIGPFTASKLDKQRDRVLLTAPRLDYIFKYGNLIWNHHSDSAEPVIVLGDCLAIGFDGEGKTFGAWGVKDGTETIDQCWSEMVKFDTKGGFSIGGKIPPGTRKCSGSECSLVDPEVLEVSWTPSPAQDLATVYYINKFAKAMIRKAEEGVDTFEMKSAFKKFDQRLEGLYKNLPEENTDWERFVKNPCVDDISQGLMEVGLKKSEVREIIEDYIITKKEQIIGEMNMTEQEEVKKEEMAPAPTPQVTTAGNETLELLRGILDKLDALLAVQKPQVPDAVPNGEANPNEPPVEPPAEGEGAPPEAEPEKGAEEGTMEPEGGEESAPPPKDDEEKDDKAEKAMDDQPEVDPAPAGGGEAIPGETAEPDVTDDAKGGGSDIPDAPLEDLGSATPTDPPSAESAVGEDIPPIPTMDQAVKGVAKKNDVKISELFTKNGIKEIRMRPNLDQLGLGVNKTDRVTGNPLKGSPLDESGGKRPTTITELMKQDKDFKITRRNET